MNIQSKSKSFSLWYNYDTNSYEERASVPTTAEELLPYLPGASNPAARWLFLILVEGFNVPLQKAYLYVLSRMIGDTPPRTDWSEYAETR